MPFSEWHTVYKNPDGAGYILDVQVEINSHFTTRVVVPLLVLEDIPVHAKILNPVFEIEGESVVMVTLGLAAVPCQILKRPAGSLAGNRAEIVSALDLLFQGF